MANTFNLGNGSWAQKTEKLLAYNAENDNYKPLPFDFDRSTGATRVNKQGLIETVGTDEPRIDFLNNTKGHLLLEPQRTNIITYSEDFNAAGWNTFSVDGGTVIRTSNYSISPSGEQNSTKLNFTSEYVSLFYNFTGISGDASASIYVKGVAGEVIAFGFGTDVSFGQDFTLNGQWQRLEFNATSTNTSLNITAWGSTRNATEIEVYGAQLEPGSYATSYIPTQGSAVTRSAESCNGAGNSTVINSTEGVLYAEIAALADDGTSRRISLSSGSTSNTVEILFQNTGTVSFQVKSGNSFQGGGTFNLTQTEFNKIAVKYKANDLALWVNGSERSTDTSANTPIGLSELAFDNGGGGSYFYGNVKDIKVYNTALSDSELQALTS